MTVQLYARDVGAGTPVVLLHAFPLSSAMWLEQRERLSGRFRVITPDMRGFGGSLLGEDEPSVDVMADDVARMLRGKGLDRAVVGGLSMGGYVAMALARRHPQRILGLVLANTRASADSAEVREARLRQADRVEADNGVQVLVDEILPRLVGPTTYRQRPLVYGRVRGLVQSAPPRAAAWTLRAMAARPESFAALRGTKVPVLVMAGAEDEVATEDDARAMADALPNAELQVIPRAGHLTAVEQPQLFTQSVVEFASALARTLAGGPNTPRS